MYEAPPPGKWVKSCIKTDISGGEPYILSQSNLPPAPRTAVGSCQGFGGSNPTRPAPPEIPFSCPQGLRRLTGASPPASTLGLWLGRSIIVPHCGSSPLRSPPGGSKKPFPLPPLQGVLRAAFGLALAPRLAAGMCLTACVFGFQGSPGSCCQLPSQLGHGKPKCFHPF